MFKKKYQSLSNLHFSSINLFLFHDFFIELIIFIILRNTGEVNLNC